MLRLSKHEVSTPRPLPPALSASRAARRRERRRVSRELAALAVVFVEPGDLVLVDLDAEAGAFEAAPERAVGDGDPRRQAELAMGVLADQPALEMGGPVELVEAQQRADPVLAVAEIIAAAALDD